MNDEERKKRRDAKEDTEFGLGQIMAIIWFILIMWFVWTGITAY